MEGRYLGKSKWLAVTLAFFFGIVGAHKFYLEERKAGWLYLVFFWTTIPLFLGIIDSIILATKSQAEFSSLGSANSNSKSNGYVSFDSNAVENAPLWKRKSFLAATGGFALLLGIILFGPAPDPTRTTNGAAPTTSQSGQTGELSAAENRACRAMLSSDKAVANVGIKLTSGQAVSSAEINSIRSALTSVNAAYKALDGQFYWYLVSQGNALDSLDKALRGGDQRGANTALRSYLSNDDYSLYCR